LRQRGKALSSKEVVDGRLRGHDGVSVFIGKLDGLGRRRSHRLGAEQIKVFCCFFSKKQCFLTVTL
jgi:hypothetical protein